MKIGVTSKLPPEKGAAGPSGPGDGARAVAAAALGWWGWQGAGPPSWFQFLRKVQASRSAVGENGAGASETGFYFNRCVNQG